MAVVKLTKLILNGAKWPGMPVNLGMPTDGWDNTVDNFNSSDATHLAFNPPVPIGQKRQLYTDNSYAPGYYTMMYLCFHSFESGAIATNCISGDYSDGYFWCAPVRPEKTCMSTSMWADTSGVPWFVVSKCATAGDQTRGGPVAVPCCTHINSDGTVAATNGYGDGYGWFWVDGVCPAKDVTIFQGLAGSQAGADITTDALMGHGAVMLEVTGATGDLMSCEVSNIGDETTLNAFFDPGSLAIGWICQSGA